MLFLSPSCVIEDKTMNVNHMPNEGPNKNEDSSSIPKGGRFEPDREQRKSKSQGFALMSSQHKEKASLQEEQDCQGYDLIRSRG